MKISAKTSKVFDVWAKESTEELCCLKNDKNLVNFDLRYQNSLIFTLIGSFCA